MSITLQILTLAVHAGLLYFLYKIYRELSRMRRVLAANSKPPILFSNRSSFQSPSVGKLARVLLAIWIWRHHCWELDAKSVPPGYIADRPPSFPGSFEGQRVKAECVRC